MNSRKNDADINKRFRTIFEQSPISTQIFSPDGTTKLVNKAWEKLWGVKLEQIKGYNILKDKQLKKKGILPLILKAFKGEIVKNALEHWLKTVLMP
ncbi:MAG TPA: PAS domain S-box protein [Candidatus Nitrosocosmicus sp.]|nr:PAS domain S-box protein [Candidatus Nitrosocosmicus sp.]